MKLKKLELFGFKSFYDKTIFDFSDGITAIVGPNGCGKSNIVDAIRWVLGEHAPSYLRSKALEDVIFAGSDAAGPLGMAEVTLTFVNEEGGGPPGYESFAEIQVTRRTFRDGESEFFINKVPCRLKDIAELFLDTGAGARGYAIIEQGKIMTIVNARPDEKRLIIEEAAGVAKFRVRRKEAERKMENTRQNLARVKDVLDEVRRQLGSLDRQVRKAERFKALREELRGLDLLIASRKFRDLSRERESACAEQAGEEASLVSLRTGISRLETERETARLRLVEAENAARELGAAHAALKETAARREADWNGYSRESSQLRRMIDEVTGEIAAIEGEIADLGRRLEESEQAGRGARESVAAAEAAVTALSEASERSREEFQGHQERYERARSDLIVRVNLHSTARSGADSYRRSIEEIERSLARLDDRIAEAGASVENAVLAFGEASEQESACRNAFAETGRAWEEAGALFADASSRLDSVVENHRKVDGMLQASASRLETLSRVYERKDWATSGVRAVLSHYNGREDGEKGVFGVIGDLVETDSAYEKAVEAVLGDRMQSIVVRDHEEGLSALRYLKESREGRGSFVPVSLRSREEPTPYAGEDGVIAPLAEIVRVPPECRDLVRGLLGGTIVVRDMECALNLWNRNGVWNTYVTLDGDMITAEGALAGGAQEEGQTGILAVKREMRDLEREIAGLSAEAARLKSEEEEIRRNRSALDERKEDLFLRREACAEELRQAEQLRAQTDAGRTQAGAALDSLAREKEYLLGELGRIRDESLAMQEAAQLSELAKGEEEEKVRSLTAALEEMRARAEEARERLHAGRIELTRLAGLEQSERTAHKAMEDVLAEKRLQAEERRKRKAGYEERSRFLEEALESGRGAIEEAAGELARMQERIDAQLGETASISSLLESLEGSLKAERRGEASSQDRITEHRLRSQRIENDLSNLDTQTWQRYEIHPWDLPAPEEGGDPEAEASEFAAWESRAGGIRERISSIGDVNLASIEEHRELSERASYLSSQKEDLEKSLDDLSKAIQRINRTTRERFSETFDRINEKLQEVFPKLFQGGRAFLTLCEEENILETGVEIVVQPPGKKLLPLKSLSGGEKSLAAASLIFSIFLVKPSPFCLLDEADTALDEANIDRFNALVREMSSRYQFLLITHSKRTMELADSLYGITMEKPGISKVVSVKFQA